MKLTWLSWIGLAGLALGVVNMGQQLAPVARQASLCQLPLGQSAVVGGQVASYERTDSGVSALLVNGGCQVRVMGNANSMAHLMQVGTKVRLQATASTPTLLTNPTNVYRQPVDVEGMDGVIGGTPMNFYLGKDTIACDNRACNIKYRRGAYAIGMITLSRRQASNLSGHYATLYVDGESRLTSFTIHTNL